MCSLIKCLNRVISCLIALFLLFSLSGCESKEAAAGELPKATDSLVVYAGPYVADFLKAAVRQFSALYPDVDVEVRDFGDIRDSPNEMDYLEVLKNELSAGDGPDLVLYTWGEIEDIQKLAGSGVFQDLSGYIAADSDFNPGDYNTAVMEAGVFDGQRLFVPLSYTVDFLLTTQETLAEAGMELPTTLEELYRQIADYGQTYRDDTSRFYTQDYELFYNLLCSSALSIVDYTSKAVTVDNDAFHGFMDAYKEFYDMDWERSQEEIYAADPNMSSTGENAELIRNGKILYAHEILMSDVVQDAGFLSRLEDQTLAYTALPSASGKPVATSDLYAAVNSNGENQTNAYNLLKVMLSEEMQIYGCETPCYFFNIPVRNGALTEYLQDTNSKNGQQTTVDGSLVAVPLPDETISDLVSLVSDVTCSYVSIRVESFIWEEMQPYFEGQQSYEECLASLENKLELYINE